MFFTWTDIVTIIEWSVFIVLFFLILLIVLAPAPIATVALSIFVIIVLSCMALFICMFAWDYIIRPIKDTIEQIDESFNDLK